MKSTQNHRGRSLRRIVGSAALLALAAPATQAAGWLECSGNKIKWNNGWTNMFISTTSFPAGSAWDSDLQNAMWHWNHVGGSGFNFYVGRDTDGSHSRTNGVNEIYWSSTEVGSALAVAFSRYHCYWAFGYHYGRDEADIAFNSNYAWSTNTVNYGSLGSPYNFELVALHELGHALGLSHSDGVQATMNSYYANGGPLGYYKEVDPLPDDRSGVRALYPDGSGETDLAASPMKRTGSGSTGLVNSPTWAYRGTTVTIEYTFANLGTSTQSFDLAFYLSSNDYISSSDRWLGGNSGAWASPGAIGTYSRSLYIPTSVAPGTYYLGFIVDSGNAVGEGHESNNFQAMPRTITIY